MKFLIDLSVEADALMFRQLIERLQERGHQVVLTARRIREANRLQWFLGLNPLIIGRYAGTLQEKLLTSALRVHDMTRAVLKRMDGLDGVISNTGVEACRVGFGLKASVHTFHDHPQVEATAQMKLTIPICTYVYAPWVIPKSEYTRYGLPEEQVVHYKGFLNMAWMPNFKPDEDILRQLNLDLDRPVIVFRESEMKAAYLFGKHDITIPAIQQLAKKLPDWQFVTRPRYSAPMLRAYFPKKEYRNVTILPDPIDMRSLLAKATMFIGGGATMCLEAAYLGIPTITCRPIKAPITDFLINEGMAYEAHSVEDVVATFNSEVNHDLILEAKRIFGEMEFPLDTLIANLERGAS